VGRDLARDPSGESFGGADPAALSFRVEAGKPVPGAIGPDQTEILPVLDPDYREGLISLAAEAERESLIGSTSSGDGASSPHPVLKHHPLEVPAEPGLMRRRSRR
jgi:hypothetical protein